MRQSTANIWLLAVAALASTSTAQAQDLSSDKFNCGRIGHVCHENDGTAFCDNGVCRLECSLGFINKNGICTETKASRKERLKHPNYSLCPAGESACPIIGAKSFQSFSKSDHQITEFLQAKGGYECLDTNSDIANCGGCSILGGGTDCTKITHADGVGCSAGKCHIFTCEPGYAPNHQGSECMRKPRSRLGSKKVHHGSKFAHRHHS